MSNPAIERLVAKLEQLPAERVAEVIDFVDFLSQRDRDRVLTQAALATSEPVLKQVWDNPDDAEYDQP